jgi:hypothetical protein
MKQPTSEYRLAMADKVDEWIPACGGHEEPFTVNHTRWQYMYNPATGEHGYLNLDTDIIETPEWL